MCWAALDYGLRLAEECIRAAPVQAWKKTRKAIREAVEVDGYEEERGVFVQAFGTKELDAALLLLPTVGFVSYEDERMVRTAEAIKEELDDGGLIVRYRGSEDLDKGLTGKEGVFLACSFWLAECLAQQGRVEEAAEVFDRASSASNDVGLFSEEYDPQRGEMLGNFPQALTHLSHLNAMVALTKETGE
jgi:GH15 family glucan-1,4-alpha-glucosidase